MHQWQAYFVTAYNDMYRPTFGGLVFGENKERTYFAKITNVCTDPLLALTWPLCPAPTWNVLPPELFVGLPQANAAK